MKSLNNDVDLFSCLYIGCQNRDGNLDKFFQHENQTCPLHYRMAVASSSMAVKSDLLTCLEDFSQPKSEVPPTSCIVLDGAVITQLLKLATAKSFNEYVP